MNKRVLSVAKVLYWFAAVILLFFAAIALAGALFGNVDRNGKLGLSALAVIFVTSLSGLTLLRFKRNWLSASITTGHCVLFVIGVAATAFADRIIAPRTAAVPRGLYAPSLPGAPPSTTPTGAAPLATSDRWATFQVCRPLMSDAQELADQASMLALVQVVLVQTIKDDGARAAQAKAKGSLKQILEAQRATKPLIDKFRSCDLPPQLPEMARKRIRTYCNLQSEQATITEGMAGVLVRFALTGEVALIAGLLKAQKELNAIDNDVKRVQTQFFATCIPGDDTKK
jgi:hypothetical protein